MKTAEQYTVWPDMGPVREDEVGRIFGDNRSPYRWAHLDGRANIQFTLRTGRWSISTVHPYDLTDYHYAISDDGKEWRICRIVGGFSGTPRLFATMSSEDPHEVVAQMRELDRPLKAHIDTN